MTTNFLQVELNVVFKTPKTIGDLFPFKDNIKRNENKSLVVYKVKCKFCSATYIGKTERIFEHRIKEHQKSDSSSCKQHELSTGHEMDFKNVEILENANTDFRLRIKELLHILKQQPSLNKQLNSQSGYDIKTLTIKAYPQHQKAQT